MFALTARTGLTPQDPFHFGEFLASAPSFLHSNAGAAVPLTIHGALDYLPALLGRSVWGADNHFLPTGWLYRVLNFATALVFFLLASEYTRGKQLRPWLLVLAAITAPQIVNYRDLFLLISLYFFLRLHSDLLSRRRHFYFQVTLGVMLGAGIFWSFDRGLAGIIALGGASAYMGLKDRRYYIAAALSLAFFLLSGLAFTGFGLHAYFSNVRFLIETSSQWHYGWGVKPLSLTAFAVTVNLVALAVFARHLLTQGKVRNSIGEFAAVALAAALMLRIGTNRADAVHIHTTLILPALLGLASAGAVLKAGGFLKGSATVMLVGAFMLTIEEKDLLLFVVAALVAYAAFPPLRPNALSAVRMSLFAASVVLVVVYTLFGIAKAFRGSEYAWIGTVASPPTNQDAATEGVRWAADRLRHHGVDCVVDMSNNGVINGLLERPSCSRITYPVYAVTTHEPELIAAVRERGPNAVLFRSTHWAYSIDGKPMDTRFPELTRYLLSAYPNEECAHGYCIRYR